MEKQEKKTSKVKAWWGRYKYHILGFGAGIGAFGYGCLMGNYVSNYRRRVGELRLHDKGIIKYFDPETGMEVDVDEACKVVKRVFNVKK